MIYFQTQLVDFFILNHFVLNLGSSYEPYSVHAPSYNFCRLAPRIWAARRGMQAVRPLPQYQISSFSVSICAFAKIFINSSVDLKQFCSSNTSEKGRFNAEGTHPDLQFFLGSLTSALYLGPLLLSIIMLFHSSWEVLRFCSATSFIPCMSMIWSSSFFTISESDISYS